MNFHSKIKITGELSIQKFDEKNNLVEQVNVPNLVVTTGKEHIAQRIAGNSETIMSHMAIGQGVATPALTNVALVNELAREALVLTTVTSTDITYTATFGAGVGTGSITEAGIFNAASAGDMLCRTTFPAIAKTASDTIAISWTITVG